MSKAAGLGAAGATAAFAPRRADSTESSVRADTAPAGFLSTLASASTTGLIEVPTDDRLADNPENPPGRVLKDIDGLAGSIQRRGLLQAIVVMRASAFLASRPGVVLPPQVEWVLLAGHRRRAAAHKAGLDTLPAVVRDDQAGQKDTTVTALVENMQRVPLSPMEEARALATLRDLSLSQREIAAETGISQGKVSKRLSLLELPTRVQDAIDAGAIDVTAALTMARELPSPAAQIKALDMAMVEKKPLEAAVRQLKRETTTEPEPPAAPENSLVAEESALAADPAPAARSNPPAPVDGPPASTSDPAPDRVEPPESAGPADDLEQQATAAKARAEACQAAVDSALKTTEITDLLVDIALDPPQARPGRALATAARWAGVVLSEDQTEGIDAILRTGGKPAQRLAVAMALARREHDLTRGGHASAPWTPASRRHVQRLITWGVHRASTYELTKLADPEEQQ